MKRLFIIFFIFNILISMGFVKNEIKTSYACKHNYEVLKSKVINSNNHDIDLSYLPEEVKDGNSNFDEAQDIVSNENYSFNFQNENDIDYYHFSTSFANYYSITPGSRSFDLSVYSMDKTLIKHISYNRLAIETFYVEDDVYLVASANTSAGTYNFMVNVNNTHNGESYTNVKSYKSYYGQKTRMLNSVINFNVYLDDSFKNSYSEFARSNLINLYEDAVTEINKLGYVRFVETPIDQASIKIFYNKCDSNGILLGKKVGLTEYITNSKKTKLWYSIITYNSELFSETVNAELDNLYNNALYVIIHELLHSIGLNHTESSNTDYNKQNVMYFENRIYKKFGAYDIASYRKLWG